MSTKSRNMHGVRLHPPVVNHHLWVLQPQQPFLGRQSLTMLLYRCSILTRNLIVGANTGAPTAPAPDDASSTETRQTEGDMNAFLVFLWNARS